MQTSKAAAKIMKPTVPLRIPPTKGIKPKIVVIGEKNQQIPKTIKKYDKTRMIRVIIFDFLTALSTISFLLSISYSTKLISSMGFKSSAIQLDMQQHAGS